MDLIRHHGGYTNGTRQLNIDKR